MSELSVPLNSSTGKSRAAVAPSLAARVRPMLTALNLHFAGACLLALINVYLLLHLFLVWRQTANNDADALAEQTVQRETAEIAAQPLRGLDVKLKKATEDADRFSDKRLPFADSQVLAELGALAKKQNVKLTRVQYPQAPVLTGTAHEMTEVRMDASLSGDYRPLVQFVNALERDKVFFVIDGVTLSGQQSGTVGLRLRLTTYLRPAHAGEVSKNVVVQDPADPGSLKVVPAAVAARPGARAMPLDTQRGGPAR